MVVSCCAVGCTYRHKKGGFGFFRFPADKNRRFAWTNAIRRKNWEPTNESRVCGQHFQTGKPSSDPKDPDYVPSQFSFNENSLVRKKKKISRFEKNSSCRVCDTSHLHHGSAAKSQKASKKENQKRKSHSELKILQNKGISLITNDGKEINSNDMNEEIAPLTDEQLNIENIEVKPDPDVFPDDESGNFPRNFNETAPSSYLETGVLTEIKDDVMSDICASDEETNFSSRNESAEVLRHRLNKLSAVNEKLEKRLKESQMLCKLYIKENASLKEVIDHLRLIMSVSNDN